MEKKSKKRIYFTHDNGGRPFKVEIKKNLSDGKKKYMIKIYKLKETDSPNMIYETEHAYTYQTNRLFIGKSPFNKMTEYSGGYGPRFDGNSILFRLHHNTYIFVGAEIFSFTTKNKIKSYSSPVGNSDVPYPYATDIDGNVYLLINDVVINNWSKKMDSYDNPYDYYYDYSRITPLQSKKPKVKNFNNIVKYYIGEDEYSLTHYPFPEKDYDRLVPDLGDAMYIVDTDGKKTKLSKEAYIDLLNEYGEFLGFEPIQNKHIIQKRL